MSAPPLDVDRPALIPLPTRLVGRAVIVRPYARGDGQALFAAADASRPELSQWLPWPPRHQSPADSEQWVRGAMARWLTREDLPVALTDHAGSYVGGSGLHVIDWHVRAFEIGYWLATQAWGRGLVTDAVMLLTALAFERLAARRVYIRCEAGNVRSAAVPVRLGFQRDAVLRGARLAQDGSGPVDFHEYGLIPADLASLPWFEAARAQVAAATFDA